MPSVSLKIILDDGAVTRTMMFASGATVADATRTVAEKVLTGAKGEDYGLFLTSADDDLSGIWLEDHRRLDYYLIKDGDSLHYRCRVRTLRIRMLDGSLKTMQVDERQPVEDLMLAVCSKLGITNYEEYGLCREEQPMEQEAPATGTLTLKRKAKPREKDAAMQQLSKKLKTDDNVEWLEQRKTLRESSVAPAETLLLKRRLFYSDRKVDARDPVQLNLLYVQARDAVLQGRHPVTEDQDQVCKARWINIRDMMRRKIRERLRNPSHRSYNYKYEEEMAFMIPYFKDSSATNEEFADYCIDEDATGEVAMTSDVFTDALPAVQFAGIQCQVQYGDFQEDKHKPGFIENLSEFLPQQYASSWGIEKKVLREHSQHGGVSPIDAKYLYTKTARDLPTYGVTFFLVKEMQKGKKKLVPRLLGINANAILRLDETTKEILQVWPLTQVKTYKAGKGELFTLNFGDYSEKEYCVKTNDAYRIRDILQSYIDLIRKKMAGPYNAQADESGVVYTATVESSKGHTMEVVSHSSSKAVETSFVGPSKLISYEQGSTVQAQGAQVMTAQQVIVTSRQHNEQTATTGGVAMRGEMSVNTVRKLNDLNGNAVCIVKLLTEPTEDNIEEGKKIIGIISQNMPVLIEGVKQHIEKQPDEPARKKLTFELSELKENVDELAKFKSPSDAQEAAMKVADLTTQMYFALDPRSKRNSKILRHSRQSFIDDDRTQATIHRASFINSVAAANNAIDDAKDILNKKHNGPALSPEEVEALERSARDRLAKLNAAIALFTAAHADPKNIDYAAAVNSMNTIKELMPELAKDALALSHAQDGQDRSALLQEMRELCDAAAGVSQNTGCDDPQKLHDEANNFARKSGRLMFTFGRGVHPDKEDEIIELAKEAEDKARLLMGTAQQLAGEVDDPGAPAAARAAARCGHAARGLRACAQLTAPSIHEPHCRSALSAASEDLKSSARLLTDACRPLLESPRGHGRAGDVARQGNDLNRALERLENAYSDLYSKPDVNGSQADRERRRLQFVSTLSRAQDALDNCDKILKDDTKSPASKHDGSAGWYKLAELNAAIASLVAATRDGENPDYAAADEALAVIEKSLPDFVKESKSYSQKLTPQQRLEFLLEVQAVCDAARALALDTRHGEEASTSVADFARASGKLTYVLDKHAKMDKEHQIIDLAKSSCEKTSEVLAHVYGLAAELEGEDADDLDTKGSRVAEAAQELLTTAQLTAPTIHTTPCKSALLDSAQALSSALEVVARAWSDACQPNHQAQGQVLKEHKKAADEEIQRLIAALKDLPVYEAEVPKEDPVKAKKRVQFATSLSNTREAVEKAEIEINKKSLTRQLSTAEVTSVRRSLADKLATLNAAIASLMAATQDPSNPNFEAAESSSAIIQQLVPQLVQDTKALSSSTDEKGRAELLDELRALCAAAKTLSGGAGDGDATKTNKALSEYAKAAAKLTFICTPQSQAPEKQRKVLDKTQAVGDKSSELIAVVEQLKKPGSDTELEGPKLRAQQAAQAFLATAQLTAPTLHATQCRSALHQASSELSQAVAALGAACGPQLGQAGLQRVAQQRKEFDKAVEELMRTMKDLEGDYQVEEKRRLKFIATQKVLDRAGQELEKPTKSVSLTPQQAKDLQSSLSDRLAALNAAIAALTSSTRDPSNVNHEVAESSAAAIRELVPQIVQDSKTLSGSMDQKKQAELLDELKTLCAAAKALSTGYSDGNATQINKAVDQYAKAAGKLSFICTPQKQAQEKQRKVLEKTQAVCEKSSELVAVVRELKQPGASGAELEGPRLRAERAAQSLLTTAQLTAPSLVAAQCRSALHQASSELSQAVAALGAACGPQLGQAGLQRVDQQRKEFEKAVEELMRTMKELDGDTQSAPSQEEEKRRLQFRTTQATLDEAASELNKPIWRSPLTPLQANTLQLSLSDRLATLNAAIAALVSSTRDDKKPDYAAAVTATIRELVPDLVKDARILAGGLDEAGQENVIENLQALCDATKIISSGEHNGKEQELNDAVGRFTKASEKLTYTINPNANYVLQDQIIDLTKATCLKTSDLLANVYDLADQKRGSKGDELDARGTKVADAAQDLLTTAEITAHSITNPLCRSSCIAAVDALDASTKALALAWQGAASQPEIQKLETAKAQADEELARLRKALGLIRESSDGTDGEADAKAARMRFVTSFTLAEAAVQAAKKELDKPPGAPLTAAEAGATQDSLARRLGELNAAVGSIVAAPRDKNKVNYPKAQAAATAIGMLVPDIVKDTRSLSSSKDPATRDEMLAQTRALCDATLRIGASVDQSREELDKAVPQYLQASSKLHFVLQPNADQKKIDRIMDVCESTCVKTSELMGHVRSLASGEGEAGKKLEEMGQAVRDGAKRLLSTAQLTAQSANVPECQAVISDASRQVSSSLQDLEAATKSAPFQQPKHRAGVDQLTRSQEAVEAELVQLRALLPAAKDGKSRKPAVPVRSGSLKRRGAAAADATVDFMDEMRSALKKENADSSIPVKSRTSVRSEADKQARVHFGKCVEQARQSICIAEDDLKKSLSTPGKPRASLDHAQIAALNKQMEHKLARANAAAAHLLSCRGSQKSDYQLASKCVVAVSDLLPTIVTDAKTLADLKDAPARSAFLDDTMGLCTASKNLCDTAKNDKKKLTEAALHFGNQTSKLLYAVSTDVDPSQENEVLLRVRAVGDGACRVTAAAGGAEEQDAAVQCAAHATVFMYTAKLVAPSIQDPECQDSLITASKELSSQLKVVPTTKRPEVARELAELEKLLEALRKDLVEGKLVKKRETLTIEDSPLRRMTAQVIEDAKQNAECTNRPAEERRAMADFANKLTDALKTMDLANARCKNAPHDMQRRADLEDAVLNIQQLVMQCHPRHGAATAQTNIVDLAVFLNDVSEAAQQLARSASSAQQAGGAGARAAAAVAAHCRELSGAPFRGPGVDVEHASKECASRVQKINTAIECCAESPEKTVLRREARPLNESSTLLQFASQSSIATTQCAAIDEALHDLTDLEHRIDQMLRPREGEARAGQAPSPSLPSSRARLATAAAGVRRSAQELAPAFTRYIADMRASVDVADDNKRRRLADHLKKLQDRLKLLTMETGRQVATWRPPHQGPGVAITEDILKELDNAESVIQAKPGATKSHIAHEDLKILLLPAKAYKVEGDMKQLESKLESSATKLNSMTETITLSVRKPDSLARTAHLTAETALQLTAVAKSMASDEDPTKHNRIEEASQELCFVTYDLLKTAESASHEPDSFRSRRRLQDACRSLTDAINKLVRTASTADKLQRDCNELSRSLQLRQSCVQPRPACALPYAECAAALQTQHGVIENLNSGKPMSRQEFSTSLDLLASAVSNNAEYAEQCAYLLSISEQHPALAKEGLFDSPRVRRLAAAATETCFRAMRPGIEHQAKEESSLLSKQLSDLKQAIQECSGKVTDAAVKKQLLEASGDVDAAGVKLQAVMNTNNVSVDKLTPPAFAVIDALSSLRAAVDHPSLAPLPAPSAPAQQRAEEVIQQTKELLSRSTALMRVVRAAESQEAMTWVMFNTYTKGVIESSEQLVTYIRNNGQNAGLLEGAIEVDEEADMTTKSYVQTQVLIANKWLHKPSFKAQIKTDGEMAAKNVIEVGNKMTEHLKEAERDEMRHLVEECEQLLKQCSAKYDLETGSLLMDRLKDLAKSIDRCVVTMVVEDLIEDEEPMADLEILVDAEKDEAKRKLMLERKIKDLLAHLGRVTKTARAVADGHGGGGGGARELRHCTEQATLLAPMLVKAAEKRVVQPTEKAVIEDYQTQLAQYSQSLSRVRDLCDRAVDPMQFVQTAEETMQRMKEESAGEQNDLQKCSNTSNAIRKLAHRVINVSMSSPNAQRDPELMRALTAAQQRLKDAEPARALRASRLPDWRDNIAEILRATGEVESVLGGEMIFKKLPEPDQPIYNAARNLHAAVREWSARDNEIVAVAKRSAVLMAKLSDHMHADKKREVLSTSKAIVAASHEVARLARKLALECTDMRIRTNLLQVCDQIPTISGQLKMLTTVKGSFLGHQGTEEDIEAMNMLVGNAQNLMMSIQDVVNAAAGASVKIRSQRGGPRMRWVRKKY